MESPGAHREHQVAWVATKPLHLLESVNLLARSIPYTAAQFPSYIMEQNLHHQATTSNNSFALRVHRTRLVLCSPLMIELTDATYMCRRSFLEANETAFAHRRRMHNTRDT